MSRTPRDCEALTVSPAIPCDYAAPTPVPVPGTLALILVALAGMRIVRGGKR